MDNPSRDSQQSGEKKPLLGGSQVLPLYVAYRNSSWFFCPLF